MKRKAVALLLALVATTATADEQLVLEEQYVDGQDGIDGISVANDSLSMSPDGKHVYAAGGSFAFSGEPDRGALVVFERNAADGRLTFLQSIRHGVDISLMVAASGTVVSPDGKYVYVTAATTSFFGGRYIVFSRAGATGLLTEVAAYNGGFLNRAIGISPDGDSVYIGGGHGLLSLARAADGTLTAIPGSEEPGSFEVDDIAISRDGAHLYIAGSRCPGGSGNCFPLIYGIVPMTRDNATGALVAASPIEIPELGLTRRLVLSQDGRYLYASGSGITVFERDATDGALTFVSHAAGVGGGNADTLPISRDGKRLFANGQLVDSSDPAALQVIDDIFDEVGLGVGGHTANPGFNHLYNVGYDTETETYMLSLFRVDGRPVILPAGDLACTGCVDAIDLAADAVTSGKIADDAVTTADLGFRAVTARNIEPGAVKEGKLVDRSVTKTKLGLGSIGTNKFIDAAVERRKLAADAVGTNKIEDTAVTLEKLSADVQARFAALETPTPTRVATTTDEQPASESLAGSRGVATASGLITTELPVAQSAKANCAALRARLGSLTDSGPTRRYRVRLGPGIYDCTDVASDESAVVMRPYVDLEGSGQNVTRIVGSVAAAQAGAVALANHAELRGLTVQNTAGWSSPAHALWVPDGVSGGVSSVRLSGHEAGGALIGCAKHAGRTVVSQSELRGASASACPAVFVRSRLETHESPPGQRCVASYDGNFAALNERCQPAQ